MKMKIKLLTGLMLLTGALTAADTAAGKAAYDRACKSCHGLDGTANDKIAAAMKVEMRPLGSKEVQGLSDAALKTVITEGHGKMKPVKSVSGGDVDNVVAYLRTFKK
jgi:mono/diheme cytochrome c family protein